MGQTEAYLHLSRAAEFHCEHAIKLAQLGRVDEAIATAHQRLATPDDMVRVVQAVAAADKIDAALEGSVLPERSLV